MRDCNDLGTRRPPVVTIRVTSPNRQRTRFSTLPRERQSLTEQTPGEVLDKNQEEPEQGSQPQIELLARIRVVKREDTVMLSFTVIGAK